MTIEELKAYLKLELPSEKLAKTLYHSLLPEVLHPPSESRSRTVIEQHNSIIKITIIAKDLSALRASLNTYLYWITGILKSINTAYRMGRRKSDRKNPA